jgi:hypothetical protein
VPGGSARKTELDASHGMQTLFRHLSIMQLHAAWRKLPPVAES